MNDYHILLFPQARSDILDIGHYITYTLLEPDIAGNFIQGLRNSIAQLKHFPYIFPIVQSKILRSDCIHCKPYKNYCIFYEIDETTHTVIVLSITYNKRDWKN